MTPARADQRGCCVRRSRGLGFVPKQVAAQRADADYINARYRRTSPANESDVRRSAANLAESASPCGPECARPSARLEPMAESESACCRRESGCCADALPRSNRCSDRGYSDGAAPHSTPDTRWDDPAPRPDISGARHRLLVSQVMVLLHQARAHEEDRPLAAPASGADS